jgi:hypothetical protein
MDQTQSKQKLSVRAKGSKPGRESKKVKGKPPLSGAKGNSDTKGNSDAKGNSDTKGKLAFPMFDPYLLTRPRLNGYPL